MEICIRNARLEDYQAVETIMNQVQQLHIHWRPDIYKYSEPVLPLGIYQQAVEAGTFFVAEYNGMAAGILFIILRHIESPNQVTRDVLFVDSMAVDEKYRGKGIGHAFFDFLQDLKKQMEDTTRRLRIDEYDIRTLDKKIQQKGKSILSKIGELFLKDTI